MVVIAFGLAAAVAALTSGWLVVTPGPSEPDGPDDEVALPRTDPDTDAPADDGTDDAATDGSDVDVDGAAGEGFGCGPDGCERWRLDEAGFGRRYVDDDALIYVDDDGVFKVLDAATAELTFTGQIPLPAGIGPSQPPQAATRLGGLLVLAYGDRLVAIELLSNRRAWAVDLTGSGIHALDRHGDELIAIGSVATPVDDETEVRPSRMSVTSITPQGAVRWQHEADRIVTWPLATGGVLGFAGSDALITVVDDALTRISMSDGQPRWQRTLGEEERLVGVTPLAVVTEPDGHAEVLDPEDGTPMLRFDHDDIDSVQPLGPWLQVVTASATYVHGRASGRELLRRGLGDGVIPRRPATASVVGDGADARVAVAWQVPTRGAGPRIEVFEPDGTPLGTVEIDLPAAADRIQPGHVELDPIDADRLRVVLEHGRMVAEVDVRQLELLRATSRTVSSDAEVSFVGGVAVVRDGDGLLVWGSDGPVRVHGQAPTLEHPDPLLVSDGTQLLRIDGVGFDGP